MKFSHPAPKSTFLSVSVSLFAALCLVGLSACSGDEEADLLAAQTPTKESLSVSLAGETPVDITRFLMVRGALGHGLSPDGEKIAYLSDVTGVRQLWLMDVDGGQPSQLTFGNGVTFFQWAPNGEFLIYGADNDGNEQEAYYRITPDGMSESLVLPAVEGGFRQFGDFSADSSRIVFASTERNGLDFDIYVADVATGEQERVYEGHFGFTANAWQPGGDLVVVTEVRGEDAHDLHLLDISSGELTTLAAPDVAAEHRDFRWTTDGSGFYFLSNEGREFLSLRRYDIAEESATTVAEADWNIDSAVLCGKDRFLAYTVNEGGYSNLQIRDLETGETTSPRLPAGVHLPDCVNDGSARLAVRVSGPKTPGDVMTLDLASGEQWRSVRSEMAGIDPDGLVTPELITLPARDGVTLHALLYLPETAGASELPPVLVNVHGGPTAQARPDFSGVFQYLLGQGIAVLDVNVRGSTGYGKAYARLDNRENRRDSVRDLADIMIAMEDRGRVDTSNAAVMGGSYGGYMSNAVLGLYPDIFKAGVIPFGVADWVTALEVASPALKASDRIEYGDIREEKWQKFYAENSPINNADKIKVPVLYSHGEMDPRIDIAETETMVRTLRKNGIDVTFIRFPDEGHGYRKLSNRVFYYRRVAAFLEEELQTE